MKIAKQIIKCFKNGGKILIIGNGGSAAMAQHMAAEFICKFEYDRRPLPAIALSTDTSNLTAIANDFGFEYVFSRQVIALAKQGDILITMSTSGKSRNVLMAEDAANQLDIEVIRFPIKGQSTASIQEYQFKIMHRICREVEKEFLY